MYCLLIVILREKTICGVFSVVLMKACFFRQAEASASGRLALIMGVRSGETASRPAKVFYIVPLDI
jgi:hypothetical protein